jgi:hypothetical protein
VVRDVSCVMSEGGKWCFVCIEQVWDGNKYGMGTSMGIRIV